jgi:hypothetical protein
MTDLTGRVGKVAELYRTERLDTQLDWYHAKIREYEQARNQARLSAAVLLVAASIAGALAGADVNGWRTAWALVGASCGALAAALTSYEAAYGFDRLMREYERTVGAATRLSVRFPGSACAPVAGDGAKEVSEFVTDAENVFRSEVDAWAKQAASAAHQLDKPEE